MFSAMSLSVCTPVSRISTTWAFIAPKVFKAATPAIAVTTTNTQVGQKISAQGGQVPTFSLASLACGFGVGCRTGAVTRGVGSVPRGVALGGFAAFLLCSCSFFTGDGEVCKNPLVARATINRMTIIRFVTDLIAAGGPETIRNLLIDD